MNRLPQHDVEATAQSFPGIPPDYLDWLQDLGCGAHENGYMVYTGPIEGGSIAPPLSDVIVVADDMAGYTIGYIRDSEGWQFVGVDCCGWQIERLDETFTQYMQG